jgi:hypothetical protein
MEAEMTRNLAAVLVAAGLCAGSAASLPGSADAAPQTQRILAGAKILPAGAYRIAGRAIGCGSAETLIAPHFWDYGGALPGLIILNPSKMARLPDKVKRFVYAHECGHQVVGSDETAADCYAIARGRREGWLTQADVGSVCRLLFRHARGDRVHLPGPERCRMLDACYLAAGSGGAPASTLRTLGGRRTPPAEPR